MPDTIRDGKGRGYTAEVNDYNQLCTSSLINDFCGWYSLNQHSFFSIHFHFSQALADTWEGIGYITYNGSKTLIMSRVIVCTEDITSGVNGMVISINPTTLTGGALVEAVNMDRRSARVLDATCYHNNDGTAITFASAGTHLSCLRFQSSSTYELDLHNGLIFQKNETLLISGKSPTAGTKMRTTIFCVEI